MHTTLYLFTLNYTLCILREERWKKITSWKKISSLITHNIKKNSQYLNMYNVFYLWPKTEDKICSSILYAHFDMNSSLTTLTRQTSTHKFLP